MTNEPTNVTKPNSLQFRLFLAIATSKQYVIRQIAEQLFKVSRIDCKRGSVSCVQSENPVSFHSEYLNLRSRKVQPKWLLFREHYHVLSVAGEISPSKSPELHRSARKKQNERSVEGCGMGQAREGTRTKTGYG